MGHPNLSLSSKIYHLFHPKKFFVLMAISNHFVPCLRDSFTTLLHECAVRKKKYHPVKWVGRNDGRAGEPPRPREWQSRDIAMEATERTTFDRWSRSVRLNQRRWAPSHRIGDGDQAAPSDADGRPIAVAQAWPVSLRWGLAGIKGVLSKPSLSSNK